MSAPEKPPRIEVPGCISFQAFKNHARRDAAKAKIVTVTLPDGREFVASEARKLKETSK